MTARRCRNIRDLGHGSLHPHKNTNLKLTTLTYILFFSPDALYFPTYEEVGAPPAAKCSSDLESNGKVGNQDEQLSTGIFSIKWKNIFYDQKKLETTETSQARLYPGRCIETGCLCKFLSSSFCMDHFYFPIFPSGPRCPRQPPTQCSTIGNKLIGRYGQLFDI